MLDRPDQTPTVRGKILEGENFGEWKGIHQNQKRSTYNNARQTRPNSYHTWENFGGGKFWRIWQMEGY